MFINAYVLVYDRLDKNSVFHRTFVRERAWDSRTRTFVRGWRRTKVRPCGRPFSKVIKLSNLCAGRTLTVLFNG